MTRWHILTVEYPPSCGGVADYTRQLAHALSAAGDDVIVWVPDMEADEDAGGVRVRALPDRFGPASRQMLDRAWQRDPGIVLLQYVPTAMGARGANLAFCRWLLAQRRSGIDIRVMFHEPYFYFTVRRPWRNALAIAQRAMTATLVRASDPIYVSTETWLRYLEPYGELPAVHVLPIPATVAGTASSEHIGNFRSTIAAESGEVVIGHFGTYGDHVARQLIPALKDIVRELTRARIALLGAGSDTFLDRLKREAPAVAKQTYASGRLPPADVAAALRACDVALQPYPDGVTTRRTSVMAALYNGVPVVTTRGALTEQIWSQDQAVSLAPAGNHSKVAACVVSLALDVDARAALAIRGHRFYEKRFAIERTVDTLRSQAAPELRAVPVAR